MSVLGAFPLRIGRLRDALVGDGPNFGRPSRRLDQFKITLVAFHWRDLTTFLGVVPPWVVQASHGDNPGTWAMPVRSPEFLRWVLKIDSKLFPLRPALT
jgi:hypothetical protein